jgi:two-component system sensor histidine kinase RegB
MTTSADLHDPTVRDTGDPSMANPTGSALLRLLCNLRWLAVAGQALTVAVVTGPMQIALSAAPLWAGIAALAIFNLHATWRVRRGGSPGEAEIFGHLLVDIVVLAWQVGWSGGIENPFSSLFLLPMALSILALPGPWVWAVAGASVLGFAASALLARPLPHVHGAFGDAFNLHKFGMLVSFVIAAAVVLIFFTRMAAAWRHSERRLARLQERFARNEGIIALATHAASVAHELNTPLGTLTLMVEDLAAEATTAAQREDCATMRVLLETCRDSVRELARPAETTYGGGPIARVIERWQLVRPAIELQVSGSTDLAPMIDPAVGHLLQALLNNAADASEQAGTERVDLHIEAGTAQLRASIRDYGAGLAHAPSVLPGTLFRSTKPGGLGVGLVLSHATIERLGGTLSMQAATDGPGVVVSFELPVGQPA